MKNYLLNCGITSKEELESILDSAAKLTSEQYDLIVNDFDEFQKLTILQELYGIICSDNEINHDEVVLLFRISRDMGIDDDIVVDTFGANKDLLEKYIESNKVSDSISEKFENKTETKQEDIQNINKGAESDIKDKEYGERKLKDWLSKHKKYLEIITDKEKGDLYEYVYWFDQVCKRVDSHEIYYSACDLSSLEDQSKLTNSHYEEYHHRMIEESDESKSNFIIPRVECYLEVFKGIEAMFSIRKEDIEEYNRYYFHSKTSLYGAIKFLVLDVNSGIDKLKKIFPDYDKSILEYDNSDSNEFSELEHKSKSLLSFEHILQLTFH